jgi:hypothetical protein
MVSSSERDENRLWQSAITVAQNAGASVDLHQRDAHSLLATDSLQTLENLT